ncbi:MAG: toxin HicA [Oscillospiraceae bacterium]|jgi:hypothetical protein|nr:toxin HicA [Oscillospiraceae bacterium]
MGKLEKLFNEIIKLNKNLRFEELSKVLSKLGYSQNQPGSGSSHYTFRKKGRMPITITKDFPIDTVYVKKVRDALIEEGFFNE